MTSQTFFADSSDQYAIVTFDANGGTVSPQSRDYYEGCNLGSLPKPSRPGFWFGGWRIGRGGEPATAHTVVLSDMTLVADWSEKGSARYVFLVLKRKEP